MRKLKKKLTFIEHEKEYINKNIDWKKISEALPSDPKNKEHKKLRKKYFR